LKELRKFATHMLTIKDPCPRQRALFVVYKVEGGLEPSTVTSLPLLILGGLYRDVWESFIKEAVNGSIEGNKK